MTDESFKSLEPVDPDGPPPAPESDYEVDDDYPTEPAPERDIHEH